jgi:hypothetical protein
MYQLAVVAAVASDLAGAALFTDEFVSRKWLMALDTEVPDFEDLGVRQSKIEALNQDPSCEVCAKR